MDDIHAREVGTHLDSVTRLDREGCHRDTCRCDDADILGVAERRLHDDIALPSVDVQRAVSLLPRITTNGEEVGRLAVAEDDALDITHATRVAGGLEEVRTEGDGDVTGGVLVEAASVGGEHITHAGLIEPGVQVARHEAVAIGHDRLQLIIADPNGCTIIRGWAGR